MRNTEHSNGINLSVFIDANQVIYVHCGKNRTYEQKLRINADCRVYFYTMRNTEHGNGINLSAVIDANQITHEANKHANFSLVC